MECVNSLSSKSWTKFSKCDVAFKYSPIIGSMGRMGSTSNSDDTDFDLWMGVDLVDGTKLHI